MIVSPYRKFTKCLYLVLIVVYAEIKIDIFQSPCYKVTAKFYIIIILYFDGKNKNLYLKF